MASIPTFIVSLISDYNPKYLFPTLEVPGQDEKIVESLRKTKDKFDRRYESHCRTKKLECVYPPTCQLSEIYDYPYLSKIVDLCLLLYHACMCVFSVLCPFNRDIYDKNVRIICESVC